MLYDMILKSLLQFILELLLACISVILSQGSHMNIQELITFFK